MASKETIFFQLFNIFIVESSNSKADQDFKFAFQNWNYVLVIINLNVIDFSRF